MRALRFGVPLALATAAAVAVAGGTAASPGPRRTGHRVVGHVYVNDNTAPVNTVAGFDRHADGTLTAMRGSPFAVGGSGTGHPDASQGSLQLSSDGRYLLAVDAGSNQISVLRIKPDGSLEAAQGSPVASNGVDPVSIAVHRDLVYVANAGPGTQLRRHQLHGLHPQPGRAPQGDSRARPTCSRTTPSPARCSSTATGRKLAGTRIASSMIDSFTVARHGRLTAAPGSPFDAQAFSPAQGWGQLGSEFSPTSPDELFVSDAHTAAGGAAFPGLVSSFTDARRTAPSPRSAPRSPTTAARPAGSRSATTAPSSSSSTRPRPRSRATRSATAAR